MARRSAVRDAIRALIEAVDVTDHRHGLIGSTVGLRQTKTGALMPESGHNPDHLVYSVEMGESRPIARGRVGTKLATEVVVQFLYRLRGGLTGEAKPGDIDAANDLAEDVIAALLTDGTGWEAQMASLSLPGLDAEADRALCEIRLTVTHDLGA